MSSIIITSILLTIIAALVYYGVLQLLILIISIGLVLAVLIVFAVLFWAQKKAKIIRRCDNDGCRKVYPERTQMFALRRRFPVKGINKKMIVGLCCKEKLLRKGWEQAGTFTV